MATQPARIGLQIPAVGIEGIAAQRTLGPQRINEPLDQRGIAGDSIFAGAGHAAGIPGMGQTAR